MNKKLMLPAMALSMVLIFTTYSKTVVSERTSSVTTIEAVTQTINHRYSLVYLCSCEFRSDGTLILLTAA